MTLEQRLVETETRWSKVVGVVDDGGCANTAVFRRI